MIGGRRDVSGYPTLPADKEMQVNPTLLTDQMIQRHYVLPADQEMQGQAEYI
ncbi:MAG: hypothetical protein K5662_04255 [Lachnospiraceae bacterium]|nr:hypothetical protein [Lachnospiraceae bacterium]